MKYKYPWATHSVGVIGHYSITKEVPLEERSEDSSRDRGHSMSLGAGQSQALLSALGVSHPVPWASPLCSVYPPGKQRCGDVPLHTVVGGLSEAMFAWV